MLPSDCRGLRRHTRWAEGCRAGWRPDSGALLPGPPLVSWLFLCLPHRIRSHCTHEHTHLLLANAPAPAKPASPQEPLSVCALTPQGAPTGLQELTSQNNAQMDDSLSRPTATSAPPGPPIHVRGRRALPAEQPAWEIWRCRPAASTLLCAAASLRWDVSSLARNCIQRLCLHANSNICWLLCSPICRL